FSVATSGVLRPLGVLGVDDVVLAAAFAARRAALTAARGRGLAAGRRSGRAPVERLGPLLRRLLQPLARALAPRRLLWIAAVVVDRVLGVLQRALQLGAIGLGDLVAVLVEVLLHLERERLELVARLDRLAPLLVLGLVLRRVLHHALDLGLRQTRRRRDGDVLGLAGRLVLRRHVDDAVRVDVEGDLDLRHAPRRRRDAVQAELAEQAVVARHRPLALEHLDLDRALVVGRGRERLALLGRDRRVARDQRGHHAAQRLDAERQRRHVEQQHVLHVAR